MKKMIAVLLVLALTAALVGCAKAGPVEDPEELAGKVEEELKETVEEAEDAVEEGAAGLANPVVAYDTLEEINTAVGCKLAKPGVMGVQDKRYSVIADKIAEYVFDLSIGEWTYRAGKTTDDISGVWVDGKTISQLTEPEVVTCVNNLLYIFWFDGDMQYSLLCTCTDADAVDEDLFAGAWEELRAMQ